MPKHRVHTIDMVASRNDWLGDRNRLRLVPLRPGEEQGE